MEKVDPVILALIVSISLLFASIMNRRDLTTCRAELSSYEMVSSTR